MWLMLRNTARRGREPSPSSRRRIRSWRLRRAAPRLAEAVAVRPPERCVIVPRFLLLAADLAGLAGLAADALTGVADALALVRLGFASGAEPGGHLVDQL